MDMSGTNELLRGGKVDPSGTNDVRFDDESGFTLSGIRNACDARRFCTSAGVVRMTGTELMRCSCRSVIG